LQLIPFRPSLSSYFAKTLAASFNDSIRRTTETLRREGFGILTDIDVRATMKAKLGEEFRPLPHPGRLQPATRLSGLAA